MGWRDAAARRRRREEIENDRFEEVRGPPRFWLRRAPLLVLALAAFVVGEYALGVALAAGILLAVGLQARMSLSPLLWVGLAVHGGTLVWAVATGRFGLALLLLAMVAVAGGLAWWNARAHRSKSANELRTEAEPTRMEWET